MNWQPIETAPLGDFVLVAADAGNGKLVVGEARYLTDYQQWWWVNNDPHDQWGSCIYPTHWMPLPDPPRAALQSKASEP